MSGIITEGKHELLPCSLCGREVQWGNLCDVCKGFEEAKMDCLCHKCGTEFARWKNGRSWVTRSCKDCVMAVRVKSQKAKFKAQREALSIMGEAAKLSNKKLVLDFSSKPWVLEWLRTEHDGDVNAAVAIVGHLQSLMLMELGGEND